MYIYIYILQWTVDTLWKTKYKPTFSKLQKGCANQTTGVSIFIFWQNIDMKIHYIHSNVETSPVMPLSVTIYLSIYLLTEKLCTVVDRKQCYHKDNIMSTWHYTWDSMYFTSHGPWRFRTSPTASHWSKHIRSCCSSLSLIFWKC